MTELAEAFARHPEFPRLLQPEIVRDTVLAGIREGLLVGRLRRPDGSFRTFWMEEFEAAAGSDPHLEAVLPEHASLTRLPSRLLAPGRLPGLWPEEGGGLSFRELFAWFGGKRTVAVPREGYEEELAVPACPDPILRAAAAEAVQAGVVWLRNGPASLWKEPVSGGALGGDGVLRRPPETVPGQSLLADALPDAWRGGRTNGQYLLDALSLQAGRSLPWGIVRESIREAVNHRWLTIVGGEAECDRAGAGSLLLEVPESAPPPPPPVEGVALEAHQLQGPRGTAPRPAGGRGRLPPALPPRGRDGRRGVPGGVPPGGRGAGAGRPGAEGPAGRTLTRERRSNRAGCRGGRRAVQRRARSLAAMKAACSTWRSVASLRIRCSSSPARCSSAKATRKASSMTVAFCAGVKLRSTSRLNS